MNVVLDYIQARGLKDGDRLPTELDLALELGLSRRTLRQCLARMELEGQVWRGRRTGTVIGRRRDPKAPSVDRQLTRVSPSGLLQARVAIEPAIAAVAATSASDADLALIEQCLRRTAEAASDQDWVQWDGAFHSAIAEATRNDVFMALVTNFNAIRARPTWRRMQMSSITVDVRRATVAQHRTISEALAARSPEEAQRAMRTHLTAIQDNFFG